MMKGLSIRWKLMLWNTAAFAVVLLGFGVMVFFLLRQTHYEHVDGKLLRELAKLKATGASEATPTARLQIWAGQLTSNDDLRLIARTSTGELLAHDARIEKLSDPFGSQSDAEPRFDTLAIPNVGHFRRMVVRQSVGDAKLDIALLADLHHVEEEMAEVVKAIAITVPITLAIAAGLAYLLAWKAFVPVEQLRKRTDEITARHLDRRLPILNEADELGHLAITINAMIGRLETSFREVQRFTGDASHELRTPLAIIRSDAELGIDEANGCTAAQERFSSILEECNRLTWMTEQLLALCREDAGVARSKPVPVDLVALLRQVADSVQPLAEARGLTTEANLQGTAIVNGDAERLRQVFYNLFDNAFKFTPAGGKVWFRVAIENGETVVDVCDNGPGIAPDHLERVFDRFYRVEKESVDESGAGLGLSIVKSIVNAHGGRIESQSVLGQGASFRVILPLAQND